MSTHKYFDRICVIVTIAALVITILSASRSTARTVPAFLWKMPTKYS